MMVFIRPVVLRDGVVTEAFAADRYDTIRGIQQGTQPEYRPPLNNVGQAPMLPPLVLPDGTQGGGRPAERIEGTRLIPPPSAAQSSGVRAPAGTTTSTLPLIGPQRGALPPTSTVVTSYKVLPVVGLIPAGLAHSLSPNEVERVIELRLDELRDGFAMRRLVRRGIPFRTPTYEVDDNFIWGATARMLQTLFERIDA